MSIAVCVCACAWCLCSVCVCVMCGIKVVWVGMWVGFRVVCGWVLELCVGGFYCILLLHRSVMSHFLVFRFFSPSSSLQGYKVSDDGKAESEDDFLKRMGGVVRLYAAMIQTQVAIFGAGE